MPRLLPRMALEPPPGYVAFVERHLESLRHNSSVVVGDEHDADRLYSAVLTDVAARWGWLRWRIRLGQPDAVERCLHRAFARQSQRWLAEQGLRFETEIVEMRVLRADESLWSERDASGLGVGFRSVSDRRAGGRTSAALRMASFVKRDPRVAVTPLAEASVAWWHAYEARRRHRTVVGISAVLLVTTLLLGAPNDVEVVLLGLGGTVGQVIATRRGHVGPVPRPV